MNIQENTSVIPDEFLAHRLGMLPINSENIDDLVYNRVGCGTHSRIVSAMNFATNAL